MEKSSEDGITEDCGRCNMERYKCKVCTTIICKNCAFLCDECGYVCNEYCTVLCEVCKSLAICNNCIVRCESYNGGIRFGGCRRIMCKECRGGCRGIYTMCRQCQDF